MAYVTPITVTHQYGTPVEIATETVSDALKVVDYNKGHLGFIFGNVATPDATRYMFAEKIFGSAKELPNDVYTGMQEYLGVSATTSPATVVYESPNAYCLLTADKQDKTVLVNRAGQQLFPKMGK